jgi:peptidoglycan/xylan/chitin deacetylase (PgdA/CDA1 family)
VVERLSCRLVCSREDCERRALALTFDDGPSRWTPAVLDLLARQGARATFFVVGRYVEERPELVARMAGEGHEVGNHTFDHVDGAHERDEVALLEQIRRASAAIRAAGAEPRLIRPPYGKDVCRVARLGSDEGLEPTVLWSVECWDWADPPPDEIVRHILRGAAPGAIVLLHDGAPPDEERDRAGTVAALGEILSVLRRDGYELVTVSELLAA